MKFSNSNPMKYLLLAASSFILVIFADNPVGASPANVLMRDLSKPTVEMFSMDCNIYNKVYEKDGCSSGSSRGLCGSFECRDLKGMGSESITVRKNMNRAITFIGYSRWGCSREVQRVTMVRHTSTCS